MDALRSLAATIVLLALRLGVPVLVTLLVSYLLARLDEKWQAEELARSPAGQRGILREPPRCWEIKGCDPAQSANCPVRRLRPLPCWLAQRRLTGRIPDQCFGCPVFANA